MRRARVRSPKRR
ncbi:MAG: hypothetical protein MUE66_07595 [Acidimicrobiia bacterium]|nr:hypothetical protein [Acidimicrobiia bacterium]